MLVYIFIFLILLLLSTFEILFKNKKIVFINGSILAALAGFRYRSGYDFNNYSNFYDELNNIGDVFNGSIDAESGYLFLNYLFIKLGLNFYTFVLFFSIISIGMLVFYVYKNTSYPSLILMYYYARFFFARDMGQIRASFVSILLLYSLKYIKKKEPIKFLLVVLFASTFHITALIFILAYLFKNYFPQLDKKNVLLLLGATVVIGVIVQIPNLYLWAVPYRYIGYFTNPTFTGGKWLLNPVLLMQMLIFLGAYLFSDIQEDKQFAFYHKIYFLASLILISFGDLATVGGRLSSPFATYEMFVAPYFILSFTRNKLLNVFLFLGFTVVIFFIIFIFSGDYVFFTPYDTLLFE